MVIAVSIVPLVLGVVVGVAVPMLVVIAVIKRVSPVITIVREALWVVETVCVPVVLDVVVRVSVMLVTVVVPDLSTKVENTALHTQGLPPLVRDFSSTVTPSNSSSVTPSTVQTLR